MKRSKKSQKYCKFNIGYDEKFFDKTLFTKKQNNDNRDRKTSENKMNIEEEKDKNEVKKEIFEKKSLCYNYDDLIKNTLFQFDKNYCKFNNNNSNTISK